MSFAEGFLRGLELREMQHRMMLEQKREERLTKMGEEEMAQQREFRAQALKQAWYNSATQFLMREPSVKILSDGRFLVSDLPPERQQAIQNLFTSSAKRYGIPDQEVDALFATTASPAELPGGMAGLEALSRTASAAPPPLAELPVSAPAATGVQLAPGVTVTPQPDLLADPGVLGIVNRIPESMRADAIAVVNAGGPRPKVIDSLQKILTEARKLEETKTGPLDPGIVAMIGEPPKLDPRDAEGSQKRRAEWGKQYFDLKVKESAEPGIARAQVFMLNRPVKAVFPGTTIPVWTTLGKALEGGGMALSFGDVVKTASQRAALAELHNNLDTVYQLSDTVAKHPAEMSLALNTPEGKLNDLAQGWLVTKKLTLREFDFIKALRRLIENASNLKALASIAPLNSDKRFGALVAQLPDAADLATADPRKIRAAITAFEAGLRPVEQEYSDLLEGITGRPLPRSRRAGAGEAPGADVGTDDVVNEIRNNRQKLNEGAPR